MNLLSYYICILCIMVTMINANTNPHVCIVGAGMGGSTAAYFVKKFVPQSTITVFEASDRIGGRARIVEINGTKTEAGGSIYLGSVNKLIQGFVDEFKLNRTSEDHSVGIWSGHNFVFTSSEYKIINNAKMLWRYGFSPLTIKSEMNNLLYKWKKQYDNETPYESVVENFKSLNLWNLTQLPFHTYLSDLGIDINFAKEFIEPLQRIMINQNNSVSAFSGCTMLLGGGDDAWGVEGGIHQIAEKCLQFTKAAVHKNAPVTKISKLSTSPASSYRIRAKNVADTTCDTVIIAAPLEILSESLFDFTVPDSAKIRRPYQIVYRTMVVGKLNTSYFGLENLDSTPELILTMENNSIPFTSIAKVHFSRKDTDLYKVFSKVPLTDKVLDTVFTKREQVVVVPWNEPGAYPVLTPMKQWPPIILAENVYYNNAWESAVSTMETQVLSARNIAQLIQRKAFGNKANEGAPSKKNEL